MCGRMEVPKVVKASEHIPARPISVMRPRFEEYADQGQNHHRDQYRGRVVDQIARRTRELGMEVRPATRLP